MTRELEGWIYHLSTSETLALLPRASLRPLLLLRLLLVLRQLVQRLILQRLILLERLQQTLHRCGWPPLSH